MPKGKIWNKNVNRKITKTAMKHVLRASNDKVHSIIRFYSLLNQSLKWNRTRCILTLDSQLLFMFSINYRLKISTLAFLAIPIHPKLYVFIVSNSFFSLKITCTKKILAATQKMLLSSEIWKVPSTKEVDWIKFTW